MKKKRNFLMFCGNAGIGKTHLCAALTPWAMKNFGPDWRYWKESDLLQRLRRFIASEEKGDYLTELRYMTDSQLLILDDVGSCGKITEWREEVLFDLIDCRYNSMKPTIITSNFSEKDFFDKYHARIHSRLFAKENTIIEILNGIDRRLQVMSEPGYKIDESLKHKEV